MSPQLCDINNIGMQLQGYGPLGKAYIRPSKDKEIVMLVGGSGVSVALSTLEWAISSHYIDDRHLTIFWGVREHRPSTLLEC